MQKEIKELQAENTELRYLISNLTRNDHDIWLKLYSNILAAGSGSQIGACKADAALKQYRKRYK